MDMSRNKRRQDELLKVAEQAAEWLVVLEEGDEKEAAAFAQWIEESPLHLEMFLRAAAVDGMGSLLSAEDRTKLLQTAPPVHAQNVVAFEATPQPLRTTENLTTEQRSKSHWLKFSIAAAVAAAGIGLGWYFAAPHLWQRYTTTVGEQRAVALDDGSVVYVNTDTRVDVRYSKQARELRLDSGEALFKVEHDPSRPFRVHVGDTVVQALGTQFNIYRRPSQITVAVIEGAVQVSQDSGNKTSAAPQRLTAGESIALATNGAVERPAVVNVAQVTAWRQRRLVFEWERLETIAEEFNRYNRTPQIQVEGEARERRYTAVFDADNPQTLLKFLSQDRGLNFATKDERFIIRPR